MLCPKCERPIRNVPPHLVIRGVDWICRPCSLSGRVREPIVPETERVCRKKDCEYPGEAQPIENFARQGHHGKIGYTCDSCQTRARQDAQIRGKAASE